MGTLALVVGWILVIFMGVLAAVILLKIITNKIDLKYIISDLDCYASMSRFQFLVFTFVIATSLFLVVTSQDPPSFPKEIPAGVFLLLGISGGSYAISKGIDGGSGAGKDKDQMKSGDPEKG